MDDGGYNYSYDNSDYGGYNYDNITGHDEDVIFQSNESCFKDISCASLLVVNVVIFVLGISGNAVVIWIAGFKMKKTVNTTWYLSLAISDFIFCVFLPITTTHMTMDNWIFGLFMCKFTSFVTFLNMFSSIFLLVIISVDRFMTVVFPVWAQNNRTLRRAAATVVLAWVISIALSIPSLVFRDISISPITGTTKCFNNYAFSNSQTTIAVSRFVSGFVLPMIMIGLCYAIIIIRLRTNRMVRSSKPFKVMTALIAIFFFSWLPYHVFILLELNFPHLPNLHNGLRISIALASANSCLNPLLYAFMGKDFKQKCWSFLSKIENAFDEEERSVTSKRTTLTQSYSRNSTSV